MQPFYQVKQEQQFQRRVRAAGKKPKVYNANEQQKNLPQLVPDEKFLLWTTVFQWHCAHNSKL